MWLLYTLLIASPMWLLCTPHHKKMMWFLCTSCSYAATKCTDSWKCCKMRLHSTSAPTPQNQVHACNLNPIQTQCLFLVYKLKMQLWLSKHKTFDVNCRRWNAKQTVERSLIVVKCFANGNERRARCCDVERQLGWEGHRICAGQSLMRGV